MLVNGYDQPMCMQCMAGASIALGGATTTRAWLATRSWAWLTPVRMKRATVAMLTGAVIASSLGLASGAAQPTPVASPPAQPSP